MVPVDFRIPSATIPTKCHRGDTIMRPLCLLLLLPLLAGCGGPYKTAAVSGRVTLNGKPLANVAVLFQPIATSGAEAPGPGSTGVTDADGRYTLSLVGRGSKGAVIGKHKVRITRMASESDSEGDRPKAIKRIPTEFKRDTQLEFEVPAGGTDSADFNLTLPERAGRRS